MREQFSSNGSHTNRCGSRSLGSRHLSAALTAGVVWFAPAAAIAQTILPGMQPPAGMLATSPLNPQSTRPVGIPLGSTEIATPGISPLNPAQSTTGCVGSGNAASFGALFDGGGLSGTGLSGTSSTSCAGITTAASPLPSTSTVGRVGIPLGSTEIGGAGISPSVPVPGPTSMGSATSTDGSGNP